MEAQDLNQDGLASEVMDSLGESSESGESTGAEGEKGGSSDPLFVQKRLKQQRRAHEREVRDLHARIGELERSSPRQSETDGMNPYEASNGGMDEQIHKAVSYALQHKEMEERKAIDAQRMAHVQKQYGELHKHLDTTSDKYDDFEEVVRGQDVPFTKHMHDAALLLPRTGGGSAGEVLYKLGKNRAELERISTLHPLDQAAEMVKLSHALIGGADNKSSSSNRQLGNIKSNPVTNSQGVNENTSVSDIRKRMKSGWK